MSRSERGSVLLITLVVLSSLLAMGGVAVPAVQRSGGAVAHEWFQAIAMGAAESGVVAGMVYLRSNYTADQRWSALVEIDNVAPQSPEQIPGNKVEPGKVGYPFSAKLGGWYEVSILNNDTDPGFATGYDSRLARRPSLGRPRAQRRYRDHRGPGLGGGASGCRSALPRLRPARHRRRRQRPQRLPGHRRSQQGADLCAVGAGTAWPRSGHGGRRPAGSPASGGLRPIVIQVVAD